MKRTNALLWTFAVLLLAGAAPARGAGFMYFKDSPVRGEVTRDGRGGWIEVQSVQWVAGGPSLDARQPGRTFTGGPGTLKIVHRHGPASAQLKRAFDSKRPVGRVQLEISDPHKPTAYHELELSNMRITSYSVGGASLPTEEVTFSYGKIDWKYVDSAPASLRAQPAPSGAPKR